MSATTGDPSSIRDEIITLIGYRGCGKTVVGRELAARLGWSFIDTDDVIEQKAGKIIREIFQTDGEMAFRRMEADVLEEALSGRRRVIGTGGGAVLARRNRRSLRSSGVCIWLTAPPEELHARIEADAQSTARRPELTNHPGLEEIEAILQVRLPIYEATADHVISTAGRSIEQVVETVLDEVGVRARAAEGL
jgi:shikimate kinase